MRGKFLPERFFFLCVAACLISGCSVQRPDAALDTPRCNGSRLDKVAAYRGKARAKAPVRVDYLTLLSEVRNPAIYIYKEKRRLYVVQSNVIVRDYPITLGSHPVGDKQASGDGRTPEGDFYVCGKTGSDRLNRALTLDYPDREHARHALSSGLITPRQFDKILLALEAKTVPPWDTRLGGQVSIHDTQDGLERAAHGGIELYGSDMQELYKVASIGTPVHIRP